MKNNTRINDNSNYLLITGKEKDNNKRSDRSKTYSEMADNYKLKTDPKVLTLVNDKSHINNKAIYEIKNLIWNKNLSKHNSTATKEWTNSVYLYNKNYAKPLPVARNVTNQILTSYFNITSLINDKKLNSQDIIDKRATLNKTLLSKSDVKVTADKVNLTVYIYNRSKETLLNNFNDVISNNRSLKKLYRINRINRINRNNKMLNAKLKKFTTEGILFIREVREFKDKLIDKLVKPLNFENKDLKGKRFNISCLLTKTFSHYELSYFSEYIDALYTKEMLYLYYIKEVVVANNIFKNWFLLGLKKTLTNLYNKKVELNIVNQKYFYLNSDIFINTLATRLRDRNNRITHVLKESLNDIPLAKYSKHTSGAPLPIINSNNSSNLKLNNDNLKDKILHSIKYKHIQGIRVEAAGRLTPRLTAARAVSKMNFIGSLKNNDTIRTNNNFSLIRGNTKPNLQYTNLNSKTRNGTFGLKGWVSSN